VFGGDRQFRELTDEERQLLPAEILKEHEDIARHNQEMEEWRADPEAAERRAERRHDVRQKFVDAILEGQSARQALAAAGSRASGHSADSLASKWLSRDDIAAHLAIRRRLAIETANVAAAQVLRECAKIAFSEKAAFGDGLKVRVGDKIAALRLLGEHLGLFRTGPDVSVDFNMLSLATRLDAATARCDIATREANVEAASVTPKLALNLGSRPMEV
jgi:hypothetical protein